MDGVPGEQSGRVIRKEVAEQCGGGGNSVERLSVSEFVRSLCFSSSDLMSSDFCPTAFMSSDMMFAQQVLHAAPLVYVYTSPIYIYIVVV